MPLDGKDFVAYIERTAKANSRKERMTSKRKFTPVPEPSKKEQFLSNVDFIRKSIPACGDRHLIRLIHNLINSYQEDVIDSIEQKK